LRPLRIAHISDLHLSAEHRRINIRNTRRVLDYIARIGADHVVITGDIAADAKPADMELARNVLSGHGLLHTSTLSVVPGNHDIFGGVHHAEDILTFPQRCKQAKYDDRVETFRGYFREAFDRCLFASSREAFPFAKVCGDFMFFGVNSVARYSRLNNPLGSNGLVDAEQYGHLDTMLSSELFRKKRKIVLIHHHFNKIETNAPGTMHSLWGAIERQTMKLRKKKSLIGLFRKHGVELVLHGHSHESRAYERKGVSFLNGGATVIGTLSDGLHVNFLTLTSHGISTEIHRLPSEVPNPGRAGRQLPAAESLASSHIAA